MSQALANFTTRSPVVTRSTQMAEKMEDVWRAKAEFRDKLCDAIQQSVAHEEWRSAILAVIKEGGLTEADVARGLDITRSSVNRWVAGLTEPPSFNMPRLGEKLVQLVRDKLS